MHPNFPEPILKAVVDPSKSVSKCRQIAASDEAEALTRESPPVSDRQRIQGIKVFSASSCMCISYTSLETVAF